MRRVNDTINTNCLMKEKVCLIKIPIRRDELTQDQRFRKELYKKIHVVDGIDTHVQRNHRDLFDDSIGILTGKEENENSSYFLSMNVSHTFFSVRLIFLCIELNEW